MLNFLIDSIFVVFGGTVLEFQWVLTDLFLYSYEAEFIQKLLSNKQNSLAASFNLTFS